jgi:hypothetical protein
MWKSGNDSNNQICIHEEIKNRLNVGNACYHSAQSLSSCLLSKIMKIKMYKTIILLLFSTGVRRSLTLSKEGF